MGKSVQEIGCPCTGRLLENPVVASDGGRYELGALRDQITNTYDSYYRWMSPLTGEHQYTKYGHFFGDIKMSGKDMNGRNVFTLEPFEGN
jgi:hypothetical protein